MPLIWDVTVIDEKRPIVALDHVLMYVRELRRGIEWLETRSGVTAELGGEHPALGTANAVASMGDSYLELLSSESCKAELDDCSLIDFIVRTDSIDRTAEIIESFGFRVRTGHGERVAPQGQILRWRSLQVCDSGLDGVMPGFIDWGETPNPSMTSPKGLSDPRLSIEFPEPSRLNAIFQALGLDVPVRTGEIPRLNLKVQSPRGPMSFLGRAVGWRRVIEVPSDEAIRS